MKMPRFVWVLCILVCSTALLESCPFAKYKKDRFVQKESVLDLPQVSSKEILSHMHQRYDIVLSEIQHQLERHLEDYAQKMKAIESEIDCAKTFSEKQALKKTMRSLKLIIDPNFKAHLAGRDRYKDFVDSLRIAIDCKSSASWANVTVKMFLTEILEQISYSIFTLCLNKTAVGYEYFWNVMPKGLAQSNADCLNVKILNKTINKLFPKSTPRVLTSYINQKLHAFAFSSWDGAFSTMRSKIATYEHHGRSVSLLRMSCPVYGKSYSAKIDPIFEEYLQFLKKHNKRHLYISNLDTTASVHSSAFKNSKRLQKLSQSPGFDKVLLLVILPVDSAFYKQGNLGLLRASYFKETFLNSMLLKQEGFYFPTELLKDSKFICYLSQMLDDIHNTFYGNQEFLEREDRCQFIDIAYACLAKYLIEEYQTDFVNWTGRNGVDDSMGAMAILDVLLQSAQPGPIHLESTLYISLWPALLHYHRHPSTVTSVRSYSAIRKLLDQRAVPELEDLNNETISQIKL